MARAPGPTYFSTLERRCAHIQTVLILSPRLLPGVPTSTMLTNVDIFGAVTTWPPGAGLHPSVRYFSVRGKALLGRLPKVAQPIPVIIVDCSYVWRAA